MKTTNIQGELEGTGNPAELCGIVDLQFGRNASLLDLLPGEFDGARGKIDARHSPPSFSECDDVGAGATANINGSAGFVGFDEFDEFGGTDTCIPRRAAEVPVLKLQASE